MGKLGRTKFNFRSFEHPVPIEIIEREGAIQYLELIELSENNSQLLFERDNYTLLANENATLVNNKIIINNNAISLSKAYEDGAVNIGKIIKFEV